MSKQAFNRTVDVAMGAADNVRIAGRTYAPSEGFHRGLVQVSVDTGAASVTFYPTPDALDKLAEDFIALADEFRALREQVPA